MSFEAWACTDGRRRQDPLLHVYAATRVLMALVLVTRSLPATHSHLLYNGGTPLKHKEACRKCRAKKPKVGQLTYDECSSRGLVQNNALFFFVFVFCLYSSYKNSKKIFSKFQLLHALPCFLTSFIEVSLVVSSPPTVKIIIYIHVYQNAAFWMIIRFAYIVLCGLGKSAHVHVGRFCSARRVSEQLL